MTLVRALIPVALLAGCAAQAQRLEAPKVVSGLGLAPYSIHEECMTLARGERIGYRFTAQPPVAFNVHFHEENAVIMPIDVAAASDESGVFTADRDQAYCLMWEAGPQGTRLDYRVQPLERRP